MKKVTLLIGLLGMGLLMFGYANPALGIMISNGEISSRISINRDSMNPDNGIVMEPVPYEKQLFSSVKKITGGVTVHTKHGDYVVKPNGEGGCEVQEPPTGLGSFVDLGGENITITLASRTLNFSSIEVTNKYLSFVNEFGIGKCPKMNGWVFNSIGTAEEITVKIYTTDNEAIESITQILGEGNVSVYDDVVYAVNIDPELLLDIVALEGVSYIDMPLISQPQNP